MTRIEHVPPRPDPHGWLNFWRLFASGAWEPDTKAWLELLEPGDLLVDVGAWIGPVSLWAMERGAYVFAIEPDLTAYEELILRVPEDATWHGAVTTRQGWRILARNPKDGGEFGDSMSRLTTRRADHPTTHGRDPEARVVVCNTLPGLLQYRSKATLVKVDVEGYETRLMPSLAPWCYHAGVLSMQVSCHGTLLPAEVFRDWPSVEWPDDPHGTIRCYAW